MLHARRLAERGLVADDELGHGQPAQLGDLRRDGLRGSSFVSGHAIPYGGYASIYIGKSLPIPLRNIIHTPQGVRVIESVQFHDVTTGFTVVPRVNGRHVTLEVSPQQNTPSRQLPGGINTQHIVTSVSGRLGEWIDLGGSERNKSRQASTPSSPYSDMIINEQRTVLIKVEEAH